MFAGPELADPMGMAFEHLRAQQAQPDLEVRLWESRSTSAPPQPPPPGIEVTEDAVRVDFGGTGHSMLFWDERSLLALDGEADTGFFWIESADELRPADLGSPLAPLLSLWLHGRDVTQVHAAAVGNEEGCVLIVGGAGRGKTTTALACLDSELRHIGEDTCLVTMGDPPRVWSMHSAAKADEATLERLPALRELTVPVRGVDEHEHKQVLDLHGGMPGKLLPSAPLRAVVVPSIGHGTGTTAEPCTSGEALAALAPSTLLQSLLPATGGAAMSRMTEIVTAVPCHRLELGSDLSRIPREIERLLERPGRSRSST